LEWNLASVSGRCPEELVLNMDGDGCCELE
jgi:hypothetical protein